MPTCKLCYNKFKCKRNLQYHIVNEVCQKKKKRKEEVHKCKRCQKQLSDKQSLQRHLNKKIKCLSKCFRCRYCESRFTKNSKLEKHLKLCRGIEIHELKAQLKRLTLPDTQKLQKSIKLQDTQKIQKSIELSKSLDLKSYSIDNTKTYHFEEIEEISKETKMAELKEMKMAELKERMEERNLTEISKFMMDSINETFLIKCFKNLFDVNQITKNFPSIDCDEYLKLYDSKELSIIKNLDDSPNGMSFYILLVRISKKQKIKLDFIKTITEIKGKCFDFGKLCENMDGISLICRISIMSVCRLYMCKKSKLV